MYFWMDETPRSLRIEQAFELFTVVDESLGLDEAVLTDQHGEGQPRHPEGKPIGVEITYG